MLHSMGSSFSNPERVDRDTRITSQITRVWTKMTKDNPTYYSLIRRLDTFNPHVIVVLFN
jgi:hypothetical protein